MVYTFTLLHVMYILLECDSHRSMMLVYTCKCMVYTCKCMVYTCKCMVYTCKCMVYTCKLWYTHVMYGIYGKLLFPVCSSDKHFVSSSSDNQKFI